LPTAGHRHVLIEFYLPLLKRILAQQLVCLTYLCDEKNPLSGVGVKSFPDRRDQ